MEIRRLRDGRKALLLVEDEGTVTVYPLVNPVICGEFHRTSDMKNFEVLNAYELSLKAAKVGTP